MHTAFSEPDWTGARIVPFTCDVCKESRVCLSMPDGKHDGYEWRDGPWVDGAKYLQKVCDSCGRKPSVT